MNPPTLARLWSGPVPAAKAEAYEAYIQRTGVAALRDTPGNEGVFLLRRDLGVEVEFSVLSLWQDLDSIRKFSGEDVLRAVYYPSDKEYLTRMDPTVIHYEVRAASLLH